LNSTLDIIFLVAIILFALITGAVISLIMQLKKTVGKIEKAIDDVDTVLIPLLKKVDSSLEHVNSISMQLDEGLNSAGQTLKSVKVVAGTIKQVVSLLSAENIIKSVIRSSTWVGVKAGAEVLKRRWINRGRK